MNTAKIYIHEVTKAPSVFERGPSASLYQWGGNSELYEGSDDGGQHYILPDGYEQRESTGDTTYVFDERGNVCPISMLEGINGPHRLFLQTRFGSTELDHVSTQIGFNREYGVWE